MTSFGKVSTHSRTRQPATSSKFGTRASASARSSCPACSTASTKAAAPTPTAMTWACPLCTPLPICTASASKSIPSRGWARLSCSPFRPQQLDRAVTAQKDGKWWASHTEQRRNWACSPPTAPLTCTRPLPGRQPGVPRRADCAPAPGATHTTSTRNNDFYLSKDRWPLARPRRQGSAAGVRARADVSSPGPWGPCLNFSKVC